jgi:hypothetical protein
MPATEGIARMSPLFDHEDWSRSGGADVPLPSFLRDDPLDIPGPSDVRLTFEPQGPTYHDVARETWPSQPTYSAATSPAYSSAYAPPSGYGYALPAAPAPAYPGSPASFSTYADHAPDPAPSPEWDPLFDPWPAPGEARSGSPGGSETGWPLPVQSGRDQLPPEHPSGPLPRTPDPSDYDVTLTGALGYADLGFRDGQWFSLGGVEPRPISTRDALRAHPALGGPIVQVVCWWMRENPLNPRALDIATELALAVGELSREAARLVRGTAR